MCENSHSAAEMPSAAAWPDEQDCRYAEALYQDQAQYRAERLQALTAALSGLCLRLLAAHQGWEVQQCLHLDHASVEIRACRRAGAVVAECRWAEDLRWQDTRRSKSPSCGRRSSASRAFRRSSATALTGRRSSWTGSPARWNRRFSRRRCSSLRVPPAQSSGTRSGRKCRKSKAGISPVPVFFLKRVCSACSAPCAPASGCAPAGRPPRGWRGCSRPARAGSCRR